MKTISALFLLCITLLQARAGEPIVNSQQGQWRTALAKANRLHHPVAFQDTAQLSVLEMKFRAGLRDPAFLYAYLKKRGDARLPNSLALAAYLNTISRSAWASDTNLGVIGLNITTSRISVFTLLTRQLPRLRQNRATYEQSASMLENMNRAVKNDFNRAVAQRDETVLDEIVANWLTLDKLSLDNRLLATTLPPLGNSYRLRFYELTKNYDRYAQLAKAEAQPLMDMPMVRIQTADSVYYQTMLHSTFLGMTQKEIDEMLARSKQIEASSIATKLNRLAQTIDKNLTDKDALELALSWSARSLALFPDYAFFQNTHTQLLQKLGR